MINISKKANQVLNIVKAKHNLKDKSQAIDFVVLEYRNDLLDPPLRPEYIKRAKKIMKEKTFHIGTAEDFKRKFLKDVSD